MIEWFFIPAHNCCPVDVCKASCIIMGRPTILGGLLIIILVLFITVLSEIIFHDDIVK